MLRVRGIEGTTLFGRRLAAAQRARHRGWDGALRFEYHYDVLPGSVISRFIARMHRFISHQLLVPNLLAPRRGAGAGWSRRAGQGGYRGRYHHCRRCGRRGRTARDAGSHPRGFRAYPRNDPETACTEKVPIADHPGVLVDYQHLVRFSRMNERSFIPEGMDQHIRIGRSRRDRDGWPSGAAQRPSPPQMES